MVLRRSVLYVPASNPRAIDKCRTLDVDAVVLDLEDAVAPDEKDRARERVVEVLGQGGFGHRETVVRVNASGTAWGAPDLVAMIEARPDAVLLPKVSDGDEVRAAVSALGDAPTRLWAMVETAAGLSNIAVLAGAAADPATRLDTLVVGTNDLAQELRLRVRPGRAGLLPHLAAIVLAARRHGLTVLDGVHNDLDDADAFAAECEQGRDFGFDGKTLIHPGQVATCNAAFSPSTEEVARAKAIADAFADPANARVGALRVDGRMVERLHAVAAERLLAVAEQLAARNKAAIRTYHSVFDRARPRALHGLHRPNEEKRAMADDEVQTPPEPQRPAMPNRGKRREPSLIEGRAEDAGFDPVPPEPVMREGALAEDATAVPPDGMAFVPHEAEPPVADGHVEPLSAAESDPSPDAPFPPVDPLAMRQPDAVPRDGETAAPFAGLGPAPVPPAARPSRLPLFLSALSLLLVLLLGGALYALIPPSTDPAVATLGEQVRSLGGRLSALEGRAPVDLKPLADRVAALETKPAPEAPPTPALAPPAPDLKPLEDRIAALEGSVAQVKSDLGDLKGRLDQAAGAPSAPAAAAASSAPAIPAPPPVDLGPLQKQVADLSDGLKALSDKLASEPKVDLAPLDGRVSDLGGKLAGVGTAVAALPRVDLAPVNAKIDDLDHRLAPIEADLSAPKLAMQVTEARQNGSAAETRAAPLAVTGQAILQAIADGRPFAPDVTALQTLGADDAVLGPLRAVADKGAPTRADLLALFDDDERAMVGPSAPAPGGSVLDRVVAGAQSLVKIRPTGAAPGQDPDAVVTRVGDALQRGDYGGALAEWQGLPGDGKTATRPFADRLKARVDAEAAARSVVAEAIATLGSSK